MGMVPTSFVEIYMHEIGEENYNSSKYALYAHDAKHDISRR